MSYLNSISAAIKGKAPIVAVPVEGHAPACIDRKRLAAWSKGVTVHTARLDTDYMYTAPRIDYVTRSESERDFIGPLRRHEQPKFRDAEGPHERSVGSRTLVLEGTAGRIKTRCRMVVIDRRTAVKTLAVWSERERAKALKKTMLGVLAKDSKRALKLAAHGDAEGAGAVTIMAAITGKDGKPAKRSVTGVAVTIPGYELTEFVIHRAFTKDGDEQADYWTVTERYTGYAVGNDATPEKALLDARETMRKATPAGVASVIAKITAAKVEALAA